MMPGPKIPRYVRRLQCFLFVKYVTVIFVTLTNLWIPSICSPSTTLLELVFSNTLTHSASAADSTLHHL